MIHQQVLRLFMVTMISFFYSACSPCDEPESEVGTDVYYIEIYNGFGYPQIYYPQINRFDYESSSRIYLLNQFDHTEVILFFDATHIDTVHIRYDKVINYQDCNEFRLYKTNQVFQLNTLDSSFVKDGFIHIYRP